MPNLARTVIGCLLFITMISSGTTVLADNEVNLPFEFQSGLVNIIKFSENPETPFWNKVEDKYPVIRMNYTVLADGWLEISSTQYNGSRPDLVLNEEPVHKSTNPFFSEQVQSGDFFDLIMYPPQQLNNTFSIEQDNTALTVYEVYTWNDMIGLITFNETTREEINASFTWTPYSPDESNSLTFTPSNLNKGDLVFWTLTGLDASIEDTSSYFLLDPLDAANYTVSLTVTDIFGYSSTVTHNLMVTPSMSLQLFDPTLTVLSISGLSFSDEVEAGQITDLSLKLDYSTPVSRDIRINIRDQSGETLTSLTDQVNGDGSNEYSLSLESTDSDMVLKLSVEFLHDDEWIPEVSEPFTLTILSPETASSSIPGYPLMSILFGLGYLIKRMVKK